MNNPAEWSDTFARALAGQYEIIRELGRGGMGVVFLAHELMLDRHVAIKTLPSQLAGDPGIRARFLHEARTAASLSHPNIVPIFRADELDGHVFFAMGFVDGESLAERVRGRGPLPVGEALGVMRDVSHALAYAHDHGVVHRDVKAENILLDASTRRALMTDFGIARFTEAAPLTATGQVLGSVHYMSPEQVSGATLDGRSDLYSLGVTAYFAMTGAFPFDSGTPSAILVAHVNTPPPRFRDVAPLAPAPVAAIVDRCLTKNPDARFQSAAELAATIEYVQAGLGADAGLVAVREVPAVVSEVEAQRLWQRAAELQALTGARQAVRAPRVRSRSEAVSASSGYRLGDVRDAALEAGIETEFVERALAEHGLAFSTGAGAASPRDVRPAVLPVPAAGSDPRRPIRHAPPSVPSTDTAESIVQERRRLADPLFRSPTRIVFDATVAAEMPQEDWDVLLELVRRRIGAVGQVTTVGRTLGWSCSGDRRVQVAITARNGQTAIHIEEDLSAVSRSLYRRVVGGGGWLLGGVASVVCLGLLENGVLALMLWPAVLLSSYAAARSWFSSIADDRRTQLRDLAETAAQRIQAAGDRAAPSARSEGPMLMR